MGNRECKTAKDMFKQTIRVGDQVEAQDIYSGKWTGRHVRVVSMQRQGYDGTILTTDPAPVETFPHHFSHQAAKTRKVESL